MSDFQQFNLIAPLQQAIEDEGYELPTPIQEQTLPVALEGQDVLGCAQTGTGKTAAFVLPILNHLAENGFKTVANRPLALILA
ncbi:MAG: DEAD/DEAH box helicase, partial [Fuerstiella sp.]